jgi:hypothetical protein
MNKIKRSIIEISALSLWVIFSFFLPLRIGEATPQLNLLALLISKGLPVSLGIFVAHISRSFLFPYMDLSELLTKHHWSGVIFLAIWYGIIIWSFAIGG